MPVATEKPAKLDLSKEYRELYSPSPKKVSVVEVPALLYTAVDGYIESGVPPGESDRFKADIGALYSVGYGLKFMSKLRDDDPIDFKVMPLEGLWSSGNGEFAPKSDQRLEYTLAMVQPPHITAAMFDEAVAAARENSPSPSLDEIRLSTWEEGLSIQIMHVGPYSEEPATIERMEAFAADNGYRLHGRHHEIYVGDPNRASPDKLKTILRHAVIAS